MAKIIIHVKLSSRSGIEILSLDPPLLRVCTSKPPEKGLANKDIIDQIANYLGCPKSHISIVTGHTSRKKLAEVPFNKEELSSIFKKKEIFLL